MLNDTFSIIFIKYVINLSAYCFSLFKLFVCNIYILMIHLLSVFINSWIHYSDGQKNMGQLQHHQ